MKNTMKLTLVAAVAAVVAGCGGGGSAGGGVTPPPASSGVPILRTMPANPYTAGTAEFNNFSEINRVRLAGGFGAMTGDAVMDVAAAGMVNYQLTNIGTACIDNNDPHGQKATCPAFTGATPQARCEAGAKGTASEGKMVCGEVGDGASSDTPISFSMVSFYTQAIGHLQVLLDAYANRVGMKLVEMPNATVPQMRDYGGTINLGYHTDNMVVPTTSEINSILGVFPYDGMTGVGLGGGADCGSGVRDGIGILVQVGIHLAPTIAKFSLRKDGSNVDIPVSMVPAGGRDACSEITAPGGWAMMHPNGVLEANTKYTVTFEGSSEGKALSKTWSFTTGTDRLHQISK